MNRDELMTLARSLKQLRGSRDPQHFTWLARGPEGTPWLSVSRQPMPMGRLQQLRAAHPGTRVVRGTVGVEDGELCFRSPDHDHDAFQRHVGQTMAARLPMLGHARFAAPVSPDGASRGAEATPVDGPPTSPAPVPTVLEDLLRAIGSPEALRRRADRAVKVAGRADRQVGQVVGTLTRQEPAAPPAREELSALSDELDLLARSLDDDIAAITAALRDLDQSLPERVEGEADQNRIRKLQVASARLGAVVRTQQAARNHVEQARHMLLELDQTLTALVEGPENTDGD